MPKDSRCSGFGVSCATQSGLFRMRSYSNTLKYDWLNIVRQSSHPPARMLPVQKPVRIMVSNYHEPSENGVVDQT